MAKLYFRYGAMNSSKSANALMVKFNYEERDQKVLLMKPVIDIRDGVCTIKSRAGLSEVCIPIDPETDIQRDVRKRLSQGEAVHCIIIDEAQFLSKEHVYQLTRIVDDLKVPVVCYGLRTDFQGNLFEGSQWLLAWADTIEEVKTICWCGKKAIMNARLDGGKVTKQGEQVVLGGNEKYIALCRVHWNDGVLND